MVFLVFIIFLVFFVFIKFIFLKNLFNEKNETIYKIVKRLHREIVLDTETTGLDIENDRIIEIGCVEIINNVPTSKEFHFYIDPDGALVTPGAFGVHGISNSFLKGKPKFHKIIDLFLEFISDSPIVIHNAPFDTKFLQKEFLICKKPMFSNKIIDTLKIARNLFPGKKNTLDMVCKRFNISLDTRSDGHGALKDAKILAKAYFLLKAYNLQEESILTVQKEEKPTTNLNLEHKFEQRNLVYVLSPKEQENHMKIVEKNNIVWPNLNIVNDSVLDNTKEQTPTEIIEELKDELESLLNIDEEIFEEDF